MSPYEPSAILSKNYPPELRRVPLADLKAARQNARRHSKKQIDEIRKSFATFGQVNAIIVGPDMSIIAGHGRYEALNDMGETHANVLVISHLSDAEARAYAITDNRLAEKSDWNEDILSLELKEIEVLAPYLDLSTTGFDLSRIDQMVVSLDQESWSDLDQAPTFVAAKPIATRAGDIWAFESGHRLACGDSRNPQLLSRLAITMRIRTVITDPPYNRKSTSYSGKGRHRHGDFAMGAGEFSSPGFAGFLGNSIATVTPHLEDGALIYSFMDWQHVHELLQAGKDQGLELKNILVWDKGKAGMGSFYRSGHELICVFKHGTGPHTNNIMLGKNGRDRSNVLRYAGMNRFGGGRDKALAMHATVKPIQLLADLMLDASARGDVVFDGFGGSGSTLIAAHRTERQCLMVELDPGYCDTIIERFTRAFGAEPVLAGTDEPYSVVRERRLSAEEAHHGE